jgi:hypothetical protein
MRVALLLHAGAPEATAAAAAATCAAVADAGHRPELVRPKPVLEAPLRLRGFTGPLTHIPEALIALWRGDYDLVHAFSVSDAQVALWSRRATRRPVVFGCAETLDRSRLSDARLRLRMLTRALDESDAVVAHTEGASNALSWWMAAEARAIAPSDGEALVRLYEELLTQT